MVFSFYGNGDFLGQMKLDEIISEIKNWRAYNLLITSYNIFLLNQQNWPGDTSLEKSFSEFTLQYE